MSHGAEFADAQSMQVNDKRYSGGISNEIDLRKDSCD